MTGFLPSTGEALDVGGSISLQAVWRDAAKRFLAQDGRLPGFIGLWQFYAGSGAEQDSLERSFRCARLYSTQGHEGETGQPDGLTWITIHEEKPGLERAVQRTQDGFFECEFARSFTEPYFSGIMAMAESESSQGLPDCLFWRSILLPPRGTNSCRLPLSLPPNPVEELSEPGQQFENWNPILMQNTVWAFEVFLQDGGTRWSAGPLYNMQTLRLVTHFFICEREQALDPSVPMAPKNWELHNPRERLPEDVGAWLDGGTWTGTMQELIWDEDGEILSLRPRPAAWRAPHERPNHQLFRYGDSMYAYYPQRISSAEDSATSTFANGVRFEFGGLMRHSQEFRRVILRYSVKGQAESLVVERYMPGEGLAGFDGRARRSVDIRDKRQSLDATRARFQNVKLSDQPSGRPDPVIE